MPTLDKILKTLGTETVEEMNGMDEFALKKTIVEANSAMRTAKEELEGNKAYQTAKTDVGYFSAGKREVDKRQKAKIQYALERLEELGKDQAN